MTEINRRGQKVVCISAMEVSDPFGHIYRGAVPEKDQVYTVTDFAMSNMAIEGTPATPLPGITLAEVPSLRRTDGVICGWPICLFRPVNERKTDIGDLLKLATPARKMEPV